MRKSVSILIIALSFISILSGCTSKPYEKYQSQFFDVFDTVTIISGYAENEDTFNQYVTKIHDELKKYHKLFDIYNSYDGINNIKTINDNAGIKPVVVSKEIIEMLKLGKQLYFVTDGNMNIAFGSVLSIWHDYREKGIDNPSKAELPPMTQLQNASSHTDIEKLIIDEDNSTVFLEDDQMSLDVGALAKGYATQRIAELCRDIGFNSAAISVGGNVCVIGKKTDGSEWKIGIQNPNMDSEVKNIRKVLITDESLVSSGNYQRYYVVNGVNYHHIINKDTLMPSNYYQSVSVLCNDSGLADAYSTSAYNMPFEKSLEFINSLDGVEALWIMDDGEIRYSRDFESYLTE